MAVLLRGPKHLPRSLCTATVRILSLVLRVELSCVLISLQNPPAPNPHIMTRSGVSSLQSHSTTEPEQCQNSQPSEGRVRGGRVGRFQVISKGLDFRTTWIISVCKWYPIRIMSSFFQL